MNSFFVTSSDQDEEGFIVEADNLSEARRIALQELGWYVIQNDDEENE
jgi:hypothetical protein